MYGSDKAAPPELQVATGIRRDGMMRWRRAKWTIFTGTNSSNNRIRKTTLPKCLMINDARALFVALSSATAGSFSSSVKSAIRFGKDR
jgi:hypothetical protein